MTDLAHIAARAFNTPLLIEPRKAEIIAGVLMDRIAASADLDAAGADLRLSLATDSGRPLAATPTRFDAEPRGPRRADGSMQTRFLFSGGAALIPVHGTLVNRGAWIGASSGMSSYEGLAASLSAALADDDVEAIVLDLDSPGGEATGAFEAAGLVRAAAAVKPVVAHVNGLAASAAYAIASAASRIVVSPSAIVGSIGVVMLHLDRSAQMAKAGVKPTLIYAGGHKVDGNPFEPLPDDVRARFKAEIDGLYAMFVDTVAAGRKAMTPESIRATEARTFFGAEAVSRGLADSVSSLGDALGEVKAALKPSHRSRFQMSTPSNDTIPLAAHEAALTAARAESAAEAARAASLSAATGERARIAAILDAEEAKGLEPTARRLAFTTAMTADEAKAFLTGLPKADAAARSRTTLIPDPGLKPDSSQRSSDPQAEVGKLWAAVAEGVNKAAGLGRH